MTPTPASPVEQWLPAPDSRFTNEDLAPTPESGRTWNQWHFASLWIGMSVCIPTYMLAASLINAGLTWWQSLIAIFLGNAIVLVPMLINGHAGTRYGIPFPVYARAAFGISGAHVPALLRGVVACGWFGIQTWVGGLAISELLAIVWPGFRELGGDWQFMSHALPEFLGLGMFWLMNLYFVWAGTESIRWLETLSAPFLIAVGLGLIWWATDRAGGLGTILSASATWSRSRPAPPGGGFLLGLFLPWVTAMVGFWATLAINIPDFTRYARSQRDQMIGQSVGLLTTMPLFAFIGIVVTGATVVLYGRPVWNPVEVIGLLAAGQRAPLLGLAALVVILVATLTTNIAANVVAPANSLANLIPRRIGFRLGGLITGILGILIFPWRLLDSYQTWLLSYSGLLGAVGGILVCDYLVIRRKELDLTDLYRERGRYWYSDGFNRRALIALVAGVVVALAGTLHPSLAFLFNGAWFSAAAVSFVLYYLLMRAAPVPLAASQEV